VNVPNQLIEFSVQSVTAGIDAIGEVVCDMRSEYFLVMRLTQISLSRQPKLMGPQQAVCSVAYSAEATTYDSKLKN